MLDTVGIPPEKSFGGKFYRFIPAGLTAWRIAIADMSLAVVFDVYSVTSISKALQQSFFSRASITVPM